jgi:hypothetical protein
MRNISFALTTPQLLNGTKDVTRRNGWNFLKAGDRLWAVEKGMGLKKGEKVKKLHMIEVVNVRREPLDAIFDNPKDCAREGFPDWIPEQFVAFYCKANKSKPHEIVTRIEFNLVGAIR